MTHKMSGLIEEKNKINKDLKEAELKAIQAQINPHFLYNTLDMINWLAIKNSGNDIVAIVSYLAKFYRLSLSQGKTFISVKNELEHAYCYFSIQNLRFKNQLTLHIDVDESIMDAMIPKITLQPLIENAILHGILEKYDKKGTIVITGHQTDEGISLFVSDDGVGISPQEATQLFSFDDENSSSSKGYGLKNINKRLQLNFGEQYGLFFAGSSAKGTIIEIKIPR